MALEIGSEEFTRQIQENARRAREESFARDRNYEIIRELSASAA